MTRRDAQPATPGQRLLAAIRARLQALRGDGGRDRARGRNGFDLRGRLLMVGGALGLCSVVLVGRAFWRRVVDFDLLLDEGYISPSDLDLFTCVDDAEEIVSALERFYVNRAAGDGAT